jgi:hypothetical protein
MKTTIMVLAMVLISTMVMAESGSYLTGEWQGVESQGWSTVTFFTIVNPSDRAIEVTTVLRNETQTVCRRDNIPEAGRITFSSQDFGIEGMGIVQMITRVVGQPAPLNEAAHIAAWRGQGWCYLPSIKSIVGPSCDSSSVTIPMTQVPWTLYTKNEAMKISKMICD